MKYISDTTKHYRRGARITGLLSALCVVGPLVYFAVAALIAAEPATKMVIAVEILVGIILGIVNLLLKTRPRCLFWLILLGAYYAFGSIITVLTIMFVACFADEVILSPLHRYYKGKARINGEIDKRQRQ